MIIQVCGVYGCRISGHWYDDQNGPRARPPLAAMAPKATKTRSRGRMSALSATPVTVPRSVALAEYNTTVPAEYRLYLEVAYADKDYAKRQGARWDADKRAWYADKRDDDNAAKFARWMPKPKPAPIPAKPRLAWSKPNLIVAPVAGEFTTDDLFAALAATEAAPIKPLAPAKPVELVMVKAVAAKVAI